MPKLYPKQIVPSSNNGYILKTSGGTPTWGPDNGVTAYTYDSATNTFTITGPTANLSALINQVTGFTVTGDLDVGNNITMYSDDGTTNPTFTYSGTTAGTITMHIEPDGSLIWEGDNGSLFSIVDDKSGILWAASDISGNDIGYIDSDWLVQFGDPFNRPFKLIHDTTGGTTNLDINVLNFNITGNTTISSASTFTYANNPSNGFALISDANGLASWGQLDASSVSGLTLNSLDDVTTGLPATPTAADDGRVLHYDSIVSGWVSDDIVTHGTVVINARASGSTISKGTPVYLTGTFVDDVHEVGIAKADDSTRMPVIGFAGEDILTTSHKHVITFGKLQGVDTTSGGAISGGESWSAGDILYMSTTAGVLTSTRPTGASTQIQRVAQVLRVDASGGQLFIFNTARSAGLPNLTQDNLWIGNSNNQPIEISTTGVGVTVTGFTYNNNNILTIERNQGFSDLSVTVNQMSGLTVTGDLDVGNNITMYSHDGTTNPTFTYSGTTAGTITQHILPNGSLIWEGDNGTLFSIVDDKSGVLWAASDISGNDIGYIDANWLVQFGNPSERPFKLTYTASAGTTNLDINVLNFNITGNTTISSASTFTYANNPTNGFVLSSDAFGNASWTDINSLGNVTADTFTTAFTYTSASNLITLSQNGGESDLTVNILEVSGLTVNGTLSATTLDGASILSGGTNLDTLFHPKTTGTTNFVPKWDAEGDGLIDSQIYDDGTTVAVNTTSPNAAYTFFVSGNTFVDGNLDATAKSFNINHPTKEGKRLVHGSLEGPEFGVYYRGKVEGKVIELPDYWRGLVDEDTITVQLTAIGGSQNLYVEVIEDNKIYINCSGWFKKPHCYFTVYGERKDIDRLEIEK